MCNLSYPLANIFIGSRRWLLNLFTVILFSGRVLGLTVTSINPTGYQIVPLSETTYYVDAGGTVTGIPPALANGTLIRTEAADASNPSLTVSFDIDVRAEVYVCYDSRASTPAWLSSWVNTDMVVGVSDLQVGHYDVYAKRFNAGTVELSANEAEAMYFIVVKESLPILPRHGWILKNDDMPYLREFIKKAPEYNVNHIQISHDIMMYSYEILDNPVHRAEINELIDLAHAYGVTDVTLWTHEFETIGMPAEYFATDGRVDGDDPGTWDWMQQRYTEMFSPGTGCPEVDGIILTFTEVSMFNVGAEVFDRSLFKHDCCTQTESVTVLLNKMKEVFDVFGKTLYARTWAGHEQVYIRDGIAMTGDTDIWMMSKTVGNPNGVNQDWQFMDSHNPMIGTLPPGHKELIEFDLSGEYLNWNNYTHIMTRYFKEHLSYARNLGADGGAVVRTENSGSRVYYTADRINLYALKEVLPDPENADPAAINLTWCQEYFPPEAAQDIADHYVPGSSWWEDTRYMSWEALCPSISPISSTQARTVGYAAIERIDRHRAQLELQVTLDTRGAKNDYETLRNGIALAILELGGTLPEAYGYSNFRPKATSLLNPDCSLNIRLPSPGLKVSSVTCEYSTNGGSSWLPWPVSCTGSNGSVATETITATAVPFNQYSEDQNAIRFVAQDMDDSPYQSGALKVRVVDAVEPAWTNFEPELTNDLIPNCSIAVTAIPGMQLDEATARYRYSIDGGNTWVAPDVDWPYRYECDQLPLAAGWTLVDGKTGYESVSDGVLRINDTGTNWGDKVRYAKFWNVDPSVGATVVARMRCPSGGHSYDTNISVSDLQHNESIYLKGKGMLGIAYYCKLVPLNTSEWHIYRMTIQNDDFYIYLDENPEPLVRGVGGLLEDASDERLVIGSGASQYTQDIYYDYVYWRTDGAFPPGAYWSAEYNGDAQGGTITASLVPFNQISNTLNKIQFRITDVQGQIHESPIYTVRITDLYVWADFDKDQDVDQEDFGIFQACLSGPGIAYQAGCKEADADHDSDVDGWDFNAFLTCMSGANHLPGC